MLMYYAEQPRLHDDTSYGDVPYLLLGTVGTEGRSYDEILPYFTDG